MRSCVCAQAGLKRIAAAHPDFVLDVRGRGLMVGWEFAMPAGCGFAGHVTACAMEEGALLLTSVRCVPCSHCWHCHGCGRAASCMALLFAISSGVVCLHTCLLDSLTVCVYCPHTCRAGAKSSASSLR